MINNLLYEGGTDMDHIDNSTTLLNVLCLEDALNDAYLMKEMLTDGGFQVNMDVVAGEEEYLSLLKNNTYDIILSDFTLPGFNIYVALKLSLETQPDVPFICVSGTIGEDKAIELLKQGATDYILKDRLIRLPYAVRRAMESAEKNKEKKRAEEALLKSENEFRLLAEAMPQIVWITKADGWNIYTNQQWLDYTGLTPEETYGNGWNKPFHPDDKQRSWNAWKTATENGSLYSIDCRLRSKDGYYKWWLIRGIPILDPQGNVLKWFGTCTDINELKMAEEALFKAKEHAEESDRLKSAFLANMSHEIRTPMNGILGFAELLKTPGLSSEEQQKYIGIIEKGGERMLNIINDIINISKIESGQMEIVISETNINEQIEYIYSFFKPEAEQKGLVISFKNALSENEAIVMTDSEKVYAVLTNLVKNALKFTYKGSIEIGYSKKNKELEFFVKDTGSGILLEQKKIIFERFRQGSDLLNRNYEGAGLGLSISKAYIEMLGGKIWVKSDHGKGSTFFFTLPYSVCSSGQKVDNNYEYRE